MKKEEIKYGCKECEAKQKLIDYFHSLLIQDSQKHLEEKLNQGRKE